MTLLIVKNKFYDKLQIQFKREDYTKVKIFEQVEHYQFCHINIPIEKVKRK